MSLNKGLEALVNASSKEGSSYGLGWGSTAGKIKVVDSFAQEARNMNIAMDSDYSITSSGVPSALTTVWSNKVVQQMLKKNTITEIATPWQQGGLGTTDIVVPTVSYNGSPSLYSDYGNDGNTSTNFNFIEKKVVWFQEYLSYGEMESAKFGSAKINYVESVRTARGLSVAQFQNDIGYNGFNAGGEDLIYGIINAPELNPFIMLPATGITPGGAASTQWQYKTFLEITSDIRSLVSQLMDQSMGNVDPTSKMQLILPPTAVSALSTVSDFGISVMDFIKQNYANMTVVNSANFMTQSSGLADTVAMLKADHPVTGESPFLYTFASLNYMMRPVVMSSSTTEKMAFGMSGVIAQYPFLVVGALGC